MKRNLRTVLIGINLFYLAFAQDIIEGRWHLVGYEDNVMYQFEDNYRYSIYSIDGTFGGLEDAGGSPNPYTLEEDIITIDLFFGTIVNYQINFMCDGQVVEFTNIDYGTIHSTQFREGYDYQESPCNNSTLDDGDLNDDGNIDVIDVVLLVSYILDDIVNENGDMNQDGSLDVLDVIVLVGIIIQESLIELEFSTPPIDLQGIDALFAADITYDEYELTKFDIFIPNSSTPTGLVICIHGGGFGGGDKDYIYSQAWRIRDLLNNNIAVATINYRLLTENESEGVLKCFNDSKRALQYIKYIHNELNIDKSNIGLYGSSAGAGTVFWLGTNDDMKDISNPDPVLQESTRVKAIGLSATQVGYDIENRWINNVFGDFNILWEDIIPIIEEADGLFRLYGISSWEEYESPEIDEYRQKVDMLSHLSSDDPEIWVSNVGEGLTNGMPSTSGELNHHPFHAREIKEFADAVGVVNVCKYGNPILYEDLNFELWQDFFIRKLNE